MDEARGQEQTDASANHPTRHKSSLVLTQGTIRCQEKVCGEIGTDPEFGPKAADVVGLYLNPPENALVLSVDETPSIQALERAQGYLRLPDGRAVSGFGHGYKRHGATTLFAALDLATGMVKTGHYQRRRESLDFMNETVAANPDRRFTSCWIT